MMIQMLWQLLSTPGSEADPADWATRFMAHVGLGLVLFTVTLPVTGSPPLALTFALVSYALIEILELAIAGLSQALVFDSILDWVAVGHGALVCYMLATRQFALAGVLILSGAMILEAGIWQRSR